MSLQLISAGLDFSQIFVSTKTVNYYWYLRRIFFLAVASESSVQLDHESGYQESVFFTKFVGLSKGFGCIV